MASIYAKREALVFLDERIMEMFRLRKELQQEIDQELVTKGISVKNRSYVEFEHQALVSKAQSLGLKDLEYDTLIRLLMD